MEESDESDNVNIMSGEYVVIEDTQPDLYVRNWHAEWSLHSPDGSWSGDGTLTFEVQNIGRSDAPAGWDLNLVLSRNDQLGDGDDIYLYSTVYPHIIPPGWSVLHDSSNPIHFNVFRDIDGNSVTIRHLYYYMAVWVDDLDVVNESNELNNYSLTRVAFEIDRGRSVLSSEVYNGKELPTPNGAVEKVGIQRTQEGDVPFNMMEDLPPHNHTLSLPERLDEVTYFKQVQSADVIVFPVADRFYMPSVNIEQ